MAMNPMPTKERLALATSVGRHFLDVADKVLSNLLSTYALDPKHYGNPFTVGTDPKFVFCQYCAERIRNASKEMSRHRASKKHWACIKQDLAKLFANNGMGYQVLDAWNIGRCFPCPIGGCVKTLPYRDDCINSHLNKGKHGINSIQDALGQTLWLHGHCFWLERRVDQSLMVTLRRRPDFEGLSLSMPLVISSDPVSTTANRIDPGYSGSDQAPRAPLNHRHCMVPPLVNIPGPSIPLASQADRYYSLMSNQSHSTSAKVAINRDRLVTGERSSPIIPMYFPSSTLPPSRDVTVFALPFAPHSTTYNPYAIPEVTIANTCDTTLTTTVAPSGYPRPAAASNEAASTFIGREPSGHDHSHTEFVFPSFSASLPPKIFSQDTGDELHKVVWPVGNHPHPFDPGHECFDYDSAHGVGVGGAASLGFFYGRVSTGRTS